MSPNGQSSAASSAIVTTWFPLAEQHTFERHSHPEHQLVWATAGVVAVTIDDRHWVLPRTRALWVPAGTPPTTAAPARPPGAVGGPAAPPPPPAAPGRPLLGGFSGPARRCPIRWRTPTVVGVSPL